jgi:hypothetical protein
MAGLILSSEAGGSARPAHGGGLFSISKNILQKLTSNFEPKKSRSIKETTHCFEV